VSILKKITSIFIVTLFVIFITGCKPNEEKKLKFGFDYSTNEPEQDIYFAYISKSNSFSIDSVKLTISLGLPENFGDNPNWDDVRIDVVVSNDSNINLNISDMSSLITIKSIDNFIETDYDFQKTSNSSSTYQIEYEHSEEISIPMEIFDQSNGLLTIGVILRYTIEESEVVGTTVQSRIYYELLDDEIIINHE
jgi:hypothetical protein